MPANSTPSRKPALVSALGLACAGLLGGCASEENASQSGGKLNVSAQNARTVASAALAVSTIGDSLPSSSTHGAQSAGVVNCDTGEFEVLPTGGGSGDTITTPSGNVISPPPASDTVLDYSDCEREGYLRSGRIAVSTSGGGRRVRWLNLEVDHTLLPGAQRVVGAAHYLNLSDVIYDFEGMTVTQGGSAFYARGQIDSFAFVRQLRFDLLLRFDAGEVQVSTGERLTGATGMPFDGGTLVITGAGDSAVRVLPLGGGLYTLEIDADGDGTAEVIDAAVTL